MNSNALREMIRREPFIPLEIRLSNGETHQIPHPEFAMVLPSRVIIGKPDSDETVTCSLIHIKSVGELQSTH
jgi:hypothetical protein